MASVYYSNSFTATTSVQSVDIADDINKGFKSVAITNDDASVSLEIHLNSLENDVIVIKAGETVVLDTNVFRIYYNSQSSTVAMRVVAD